jgi:hypothetical protein
MGAVSEKPKSAATLIELKLSLIRPRYYDFVGQMAQVYVGESFQSHYKPAAATISRPAVTSLKTPHRYLLDLKLKGKSFLQLRHRMLIFLWFKRVPTCFCATAAIITSVTSLCRRRCATLRSPPMPR